MSFLKRLFGLETASKPTNQDASRRVNFYDAEGNLVVLTLDEFKQVFPQRIKQHWEEPDSLYSILVQALEEGFSEEILKGAERLKQIDPDIERSYCIHGIALMNANKLDEAAKVFSQCMEIGGPSAYASLNLAKVYAIRGDETRAREALSKALEQDPNQDNALALLGSIRQEREGVEGFYQAMREVAAHPGAWRPKLWLAKQHLEGGRIPQACDLYQDALKISENHQDAQTFISNDLIEHGLRQQAWDILFPNYDPAVHSPETGARLLRMAVNFNKVDDGLKLADKMIAANPSLAEMLDPLRKELDALRFSPTEEATPPWEKSATATIQSPIAQMTNPSMAPVSTNEPIIPPDAEIVPVERPIWFSGLFDPQWILPQKSVSAAAVGLLPFSDLSWVAPDVTPRETEEYGCLARSIPLFLSELMYFHSSFAPRALIPVVRGTGPVVSTAEWPSQQIIDLAARPQKNFWVMISGVLQKKNQLLSMRMDVWDIPNRQKIDELEGVGPWLDQGLMTFQFATDLASSLDGMQPVPEAGGMDYLVPTAYQLKNYLAALNMSLMLSLVKNKIVSKTALGGESNMLDCFYQLATNAPELQSTKIMFLSGLSNLHACGSTAYLDYKDRVLTLLKKEENPQTPFSRLAPVIYWLYGMKAEMEAYRHGLSPDTPGIYQDWLHQVPTPA